MNQANFSGYSAIQISYRRGDARITAHLLAPSADVAALRALYGLTPPASLVEYNKLIAAGAVPHRLKDAAMLESYPDGSRISTWYVEGMRHRAEGPARIVLREDGTVTELRYRNGKIDGAHAVVWRDAQGHVVRTADYAQDRQLCERLLLPLAALPGVMIAPPAPGFLPPDDALRCFTLQFAEPGRDHGGWTAYELTMREDRLREIEMRLHAERRAGRDLPQGQALLDILCRHGAEAQRTGLPLLIARIAARARALAHLPRL